MCHLCRKLEALKGFDHIAAKPILRLLGKLHQHVEPRLGDMWLWRHEQASKLKELLERLYKVAPSGALKALLEEVNHEIQHIRKNMVDHPPPKSTGRWEALKTSIAPSESATGRMEKEVKMEKERSRPKKQNSLWRKTKRRDSRDRHGAEKRIPMADDPTGLPELPASDIDPPLPRIQQSIKFVEAWLKRCDEAMEVEPHKDSDSETMVSFLGGILMERPKLEVEAWKFVRQRSWKRSSGVSSSTIGSKSSYRVPITQLSNCVYDKLSHKLNLDNRIVGPWVKLVSSKASKHRYQNLVGSLIFKEKAKKLSKIRRITIAQAMEVMNARGRRQEQAYMMSGGRSSGPLPRNSMEVAASNSSQGKTSFESSNLDEVELSPSETQRCIRKAAAGFRNEDKSDTGSDLSSRPSMVNLGSILNQTHLAEESENHFKVSSSNIKAGDGSKKDDDSDTSSVLSSRQSPVNCGSLLNESRAAQQSKDQVKVSSWSRKAGAGLKLDLDSDTSSMLSSRPSSVNLGSIINQSHKAQQSRKQFSIPSSIVTPSTTNSASKRFRQTTPTAIGRASSPPVRSPRLLNAPPKRSIPLRRVTRHLPEYQLMDGPAGSRGLGESRAKEKKEVPQRNIAVWGNREARLSTVDAIDAGPEDAGISEALKNSRRRRAERNVPVADGYKKEERKKHWSPQRV
jgi:hypothetical protein